MAFCFFHDFFPDLAEEETRTLSVLPGIGPGIPPGQYGLLEMFCDTPGCDCRRVLFNVYSVSAQCDIAVVNWGWEDIGFYQQWLGQGSREDLKALKGPTLNPGSPKADYAHEIVDLVTKILDQDPAYVERIKRHYGLFRARIEGGNVPQSKEITQAPSDEAGLKSLEKRYHTWCIFCGARVGEESERTGGVVTAVYYCPKCAKNYCSECSYAEEGAQYCLRCDAVLEQVESMDNVASHAYEEPVSRLLCLGEPEPSMEYAAFGIGQEHVSVLIRMATDLNLHYAMTDSNEVWAPVHAWRALGQLRAPEAIEPLIGLLRLVDEEEDDWLTDDLPRTLGQFGAAVIAPVTALLADTSQGLGPRVDATDCFTEIQRHHPDERNACVAALTNQLEHFTDNGQELNGFIVAALLDLDAAESAKTIERAFAAEAVDFCVAGDWEEVQIELGLLDKRITPWKPKRIAPRVSVPKIKAAQGSSASSGKAKKKRKAQKKSRKKNRKK